MKFLLNSLDNQIINLFQKKYQSLELNLLKWGVRIATHGPIALVYKFLLDCFLLLLFFINFQTKLF